MKTSSTLILAAITIGACVFLYLTLFNSPGTDKRQELLSKVIDVTVGKVNRLTISFGEEQIQASKSDDTDWDIQKPVAYPADKTKISRLLAGVKAAERVRTIDQDQIEDLVKAKELFGLTQPAFTIEMSGENNQWKVSVGAETARGGQLYAISEVNGEVDWIIIDQSFLETCGMTFDQLRSQNIVEIETTKITGLVLRQADTESILKQEAEGWAISKPLATPADPTRVQSYLASIAGATVQEFIEDEAGDLSTYGLNAPTSILSIEREGEEPLSLKIGKPLDEEESLYYAMTSLYPTVFTINPELRETLHSLVDETRDLRPLPVPQEALVEALTIRFADQEVELSRSEDSWIDPEGNAYDYHFMNNMLDALTGARASELLPLNETTEQEFGFVDSELSIDVTVAGNLVELQFGVLTESGLMVKSSHLGLIAQCAPEVKESLPADIYDLYSRDLPLPESKTFSGIIWEKKEGRRFQIEKNEEGRWQPSDEGMNLQKTFLDSQLAMLDNFRVLKRYPILEGEFSEPELILSIDSTDKTFRLLFSLQAPDGQVRLKVDDEPVGYVLTEDAYQILDAAPLSEE
ncbi:MAG: DUF4340 domain-containing protein [Verrucomicrobiota bacterium]